MRHAVIALFVLTFPLVGHAADTHSTHTSHYSGEESRAIKSLSPDDIAELKRGGGWGLAKAAELNGVPGPAHLLELKDEIPLTAEQTKEIEAIYNQMKQSAIKHGEKLIELERDLDLLFQKGTATDETLKASLSAISEARMTLRYTHLATHLKTPEILTKAQIAKYNALRGYASSGPCANPPKGHDPEMWRKHNGCQ